MSDQTNGSGAARRHIVFLGGGYAGLWGAANAADVIREAGADITVSLVSKDGYLVHRPRLYEKNPDTLRVPFVPLLAPLGIDFVEGAATRIDTAARNVTVATAAGQSTLHYDRLVLATGSQMRPPPIPGAAEHTLNVDDFAGAKAFDDHLKKISHLPEEEGKNTFVVIGAGMTGIELANEMRDRIAQHAGPAVAEAARVILIERADAVGPEFGDEPRPVILEALGIARVELRTGTTVASIDADSVTLADGERIPAATVVMAVGMHANPLTEQIPGTRDGMGRLHVDDHLRVLGVDGVFATGDVARAVVADGHVALMSCQHSRTMGKYAGRNAALELLGEDLIVYRQPDYSTCLDLGRYGAVFTKGFDRKIFKTGQEAKQRKIFVNGELIYPPPLGPADEMFAAMRIDANGR